MTDMRAIQRAADYVLGKADFTPRVGLVLGSGWNILIKSVEGGIRIPYGDVPGMRVSTVPGHGGEWILGRIGGKPVVIMSGRLHYYEGNSLGDVTFPIRIMKRMGIEILVLTNAAGAINTYFDCGDLMLITDHINMTGVNPLIGPNDDDIGPRFPDMSAAYDRELQDIARRAAMERGQLLREGVYAQMTGPSFETPAEIRMLRVMGADAVGMSTVPEVVVARHSGMRVLALSCMTNMAAGVLDQPLSHEEVMDTARRAEGRIRAFMEELLSRL